MLGENKELDEFLMSNRHIGRSELVRQVRAAYQLAIELVGTGDEKEAHEEAASTFNKSNNKVTKRKR
jgi:hypothetical protein